MAVKMRLTRLGAKKRPFYRVVVSDSRKAVPGQYIELLGTYDPGLDNKDSVIKLNKELVFKWLDNGAIPSDTVRSILSKEGLLKEYDELKKGKK